MLAPPVLITHKTKHEGTVRMTHTLEVTYNIVTVSQVSGRVDHCPRHPVSHAAWGRDSNVSSFDGAWSVKWFAIEAAIRLTDPDSDLGTSPACNTASSRCLLPVRADVVATSALLFMSHRY
eukprot:6757136-Pyramimonas_sp.AAC.1